MTIGVPFGSRTPEHDISIITGQLIIAGLKGLGHSVVPIYIGRDGQWMIGECLGQMSTFVSGTISAKDKAYVLDLEASKGKMVLQPKGVFKKPLVIDLIFPALHGSFGEDGTMQGLCEMLGVPYVGCDVAASAVAMDKAMTKIIIAHAGVPTSPFYVFERRDWEADRAAVLAKADALAWPVFVKPVRLGSSIGITKAKTPAELVNAIEIGLHYDDKILVEEGVQNLMDVTCCVIGHKELRASELQESVFTSELFDFDEKYVKGGQTGKGEGSYQIPARLDEATTKAIRDTAKQVFRSIGASGIARVDFLYNKETKKFFVSEVNPLPGTLYHHLWKGSGLELDGLLKTLIDTAFERESDRKRLTYSFASSVLTSMGGGKGGSKGRPKG